MKNKREFYFSATIKREHSGYNSSTYDYILNGGGSVVSNVGKNKSQYKFNGQEYQDDLGLNMTAMDYRQYDNALGRFHSMDVLSEVAPGITPYRFGVNNPVYWIDPSGLFEDDPPANPNNPVELDEVVIVRPPKTSSSSYFLDMSYGIPQFPGGGLSSDFRIVSFGEGGSSAVASPTPAGLVSLGSSLPTASVYAAAECKCRATRRIGKSYTNLGIRTCIY